MSLLQVQLSLFSDYEANSGGMVPFGEIEIRGTKGTVQAHEGAYKIIPATRGQFQTWDSLIEAEEYENMNRLSTMAAALRVLQLL